MDLRSARKNPGAYRAGALMALLVAVAMAGAAFAQTLPEPAAEALRRGQQAAAEALATYTHHLPDSPLWTEALAAGAEAARIAPDHPAPRRFLAQAYLQVGFYARSWSAWQAYLDRGGGVDASVERQLLEVASWMGLNAYDAGRREQAVPFLETVVRLVPDDLGANVRLARLYLDRSEPLAALPYLEALNGRAPDLTPALQRARQIDRYGFEAAAAYASALEARAAGSLQTAQNRFLEAATVRPDFTDAWRGAATTAERLGRLQQAEAAYEEVLALAPNDADALAGLGRIAIEAGADEAAAQARAAAAERAAAERAAAERAAAERAAAERAAAERAAAERAAAERAAAERAAAERAATEAAEQQAAAEQAAAEAAAQAAAEQAEADRAAAAESRADEQAADEQAAEAAERDAAAEAAEAEQAAAAEAAAEQAAAEQAAAEEAAAQARAQQAADQAEAEQAAAERAAAEQAAAEQAAAEAEARARETADQAAAEQAAAEAEARAGEAADQAAAERAAAEAEAEARAQPQPSGGSLLLVDAVAEHRRSAAGPSPSVAFLPVPALADTDLAGHTGDVIHVRVEVLDKPSDAPVLYQLCLVPTDISVRPACTDPSRLAFTEAGTYEGEQPWSGLAGFGGVDWQAGVDSVMAVLRRPDGTPLESPQSGSEADDAYLPMTVRIQALAVPPGAPFPGWP